MRQRRQYRQWHSCGQQNILLEYSRLKQNCPEGIYLTLTPDNLAKWSGVLFVRKGPYAPAVLRFQIFFPTQYPVLPPSITITTDIFHPLVTPLTTYTYSTGSPSSDPVSASDEERLPPGGFSLRHGFPTWYGRAEKGPDASRGSSRNESSSQNGDENLVDVDTSARSSEHGHLSDHPEVITHIHPLKLNEYPNIVNALQYLKEAFDNETMIDDLPLEAAGNPSAWKAWRAHRRLVPESTDSRSKFDDPYDGDPSHSRASNPSRIGIQMQVKQPDEWNWDGVWKERVQKGVISSISDPVLYGNTGSSDGTIRFAELEDDAIDAIKEKYFET